jgi:hypothetical protein
VVVKQIKEDKRYIDQSLIEIYVLQLLSKRGDPNAQNFLALVDHFYLNVDSPATTVHCHRKAWSQPI